MTGVYVKNGKVLVDGDKLRGCCCAECLGATVQFFYYFESPPGSGLHAVSGGHYISAGGWSNESETWYHGWEYCSQSTTHEILSGACPNTVCPNGTANMLLALTGAQTIKLFFRETRTFQESWSSDLIARIDVSGLRANTKLSIAGTTILSNGSFTIGTWTKTNTNTIGDMANASIRVGPWSLTISRR